MLLIRIFLSSPTAANRWNGSGRVQIEAGSMPFFGTLLGFLLSPWFFAVPLFGAGLMSAGITGFCGIVRVLSRMPWNRALYHPQIGHC